MFGMKKIIGKIKALTPIHHGGDDKTGIETLLRRNKYVVNGEITEIPYISGNALRGVMRRLIMTDFLERLEYQIQKMRLYHALFTGGILETTEKDKSGMLDIELKKNIYNYILPIRLLGMSYGNQIFEGKLHIGLLLPICKELNEYLPENYQSKRSVYEYLDFIHQTRKDDIKGIREADEQAVQMYFSYEIFITGTEFYHEIKLEDPTDVDIATLSHALELLKIKPYICGKSSIGLGNISMHYDFTPDNKLYIDFIEKNKQKIVKILTELDV